MKRFKSYSLSIGVPAIAVLLAALAATPALGVNLVTDPGFEVNALTTANNSLTNFPGFQGVWGQENSTIVGVTGNSSPFQGTKQLQMDVTGGVTTQAFQTIDVSSYATMIDANAATLNASAYFNANLPAAFGGVYISYFTGNSYGTLFGPQDTSTFTLDSASATWQQASLSVPVPAGTRWILFQVAYAEASLVDNSGALGSGYVDSAFAEIVPEPGTALLIGLGALLAARRRRAAR